MCNSLSPLRSLRSWYSGRAAAAHLRRKSAATTAPLISPLRKVRSLPRSSAAILPLLMLCVVSCSHAPRASIQPAAGTSLGNAYRLQLPARTTITLPDEATAAQVRAIAYNEISPAKATDPAAPARVVVLVRPLQIVSPAYIAERTTTELQLLRQVVDLKEEVARLRARQP